jgi:hypothetical protein
MDGVPEIELGSQRSQVVGVVVHVVTVAGLEEDLRAIGRGDRSHAAAPVGPGVRSAD